VVYLVIRLVARGHPALTSVRRLHQHHAIGAFHFFNVISPLARVLSISILYLRRYLGATTDSL